MKSNINTDRKYRNYKISIWIGSLLLIISSINLIFYKSINFYTSSMLLIGILLYSSDFLNYIGIGKSKNDSIRNIGIYATAWSWYITLIFNGFLIITMYWSNNVREPSELMGIIILVMVITMHIANLIIGSKDDLNSNIKKE